MSQDGSFEFKQKIFWLRKRKMNFLLYTLLSGGLCPGIVI